ncbi:glutamate--cysteine ligase catalytic subunit-like [Pollicipes pollicipes]|uniref:glutamate--cysteine ligase catalytic subunit-like n=1 Tax=Pollicipes pollicipes TaxID=41117 RepID=UPI001884934E|nr:glutamate--cysteine ligase catalytic subunit-like [Pollicipes pollicipes]
MGLLSEGSPLSWPETKALAAHVQRHGIEQFISQFNRLKERRGDSLKWGDEVEYMVVRLDRRARTARLALRSAELLDQLQATERRHPDAAPSLWRPEYGAYMVEGTPGQPYGSLISFFNTVESNMRARRQEVEALLQPDEILLSITSFPRLGCGTFTEPPCRPTPGSGSSRSLFIPEEVIFPAHPRFATLTRNIRERRGKKVAINMPVLVDERTPRPFVEDLARLGDDGSSQAAALPDHVYMDAMAFGMGCCCLQITFQAENLLEARRLYDQLNPLCPILLALTAASPIHRGMLLATDCRWDVIAMSCDCRTDEERGLTPLRQDRFVIPKSRYGSTDSYISECGRPYNDVELVMDPALFGRLAESGIDDLLAGHVAHLFIREPISLFSEKVQQDDAVDMDHFENIQSTNWQTMRFKPPPAGSNIGWRVEFRPCEVQLTDFENAAIVCFVVLLTRVILSYKLNFLIPISKVDENMRRAHKKDAVLTEKFWFRSDFLCDGSPCVDAETEYSELTVNEIFNGKGDEFPGLVPLVTHYLNAVNIDADTRCTMGQYLQLIRRRASGELQTTASWIRRFVAGHADYARDSVVPESTAFDLLVACQEVTAGRRAEPTLLGRLGSRTDNHLPAAILRTPSLYKQV